VKNLGLKQKLIYNDNIEKLAQEEMYNLSEKEFLDYLEEQDIKEPSDDEIILNYKSGTEELIQEIRAFHDKLTAISAANGISLKNKFDFIMDLLSKENKKELLPLLACFICDIDYMFNLNKIRKAEKKKNNLVRYIKLKEKMDEFLEKFQFINEHEKTYESLKKGILKKDEIINGEELSNGHKKILKDLFKEYVEKNIDEKCFEENLEHIHKFLTSTKERKALYPVLLFKIFTNYKKKLYDNAFIVNNKNFLNYKPYKIYEDNYKNFKQNESYIKLFFELCNEFCEEKDLKLNIFVFEKCCELGKWYWLRDSKNVEFCYSYDSLFETSYSKYNSIFLDKSEYYEEKHSGRIICFNVDENGNNPEQEVPEYVYIDGLIEEHLEEVMENENSRDYLDKYIKGKRAAEKYAEDCAHKIIEYADEDLKGDFHFRRHFYWWMEFTFRQIGDAIVQEDIIGFMKKMQN
jgi:hypothetical protein